MKMSEGAKITHKVGAGSKGREQGVVGEGAGSKLGGSREQGHPFTPPPL